MVKRIFWDDPYLTQLETHATGVKGNEVTLEQTIFFAFSGGQGSDTGIIGNCSALETRTEGKEIIYPLEQGHELKKEDPVSIRIDWERRCRLMRLHFVAEIVLELMYWNFESIRKIGAHIAEDKAKIDMEWGRYIKHITRH